MSRDVLCFNLQDLADQAIRQICQLSLLNSIDITHLHKKFVSVCKGFRRLICLWQNPFCDSANRLWSSAANTENDVPTMEIVNSISPGLGQCRVSWQVHALSMTKACCRS